MDATATAAEAAMLALSGGDGALVKPAEAHLRRLVASKGGPAVLCAVLGSSAQPAARHLAAVLLRKRVAAFWSRCKPDARAALQRLLVERLGRDDSRAVRRALVGVVAALAKLLLPGGNWPELLAVLAQCAADGNGEARELGLAVALELAGVLGPRVREFVPALAPAVAAGLRDPASRAVRVAALRAAGALVCAVDDRRTAVSFRPLVPAMLAVTRECLEHEEAAAAAALDTLAELVEAQSPAVARHVDELAALAADAFADASAAAGDGGGGGVSLGLDDATRRGAAQLLIELVTAWPAAFTPSGGGDGGGKGRRSSAAAAATAGGAPPPPPALRSLLAAVECVMLDTYDAVAEAAADAAARAAGVDRDGDGGGGDEDGALWRVADAVADAVAAALPPADTLAVVQAAVPPLLASSDWRRRRVGLALLTATADGAADAYTPAVESVLAAVLPLARDAAGPVREALAALLARLSEACAPRILLFHAVLLPPTFDLLADASPAVVRSGCAVVEAFVEALPQADLAPYLPAFLGRLAALLAVAAPVTGDAAADAAAAAAVRGVREMAVAALASAAIAAGPRFGPHLPAVLPALLAALAATDAPSLPLRAQATEAAGHIVEAVGAAAAGPLLPALLASAGAAFALGDAAGAPELATNAFAAFSCLVRLDGDDSATSGGAADGTRVLGAAAAAELLQRALDVLAGSDGVEAVSGPDGADRDDDAGGAAARIAATARGGRGGDGLDADDNVAGAGGDDDDDDDDGSSGGGDSVFRVRTAFMELRMSAVHFLGALAGALPAAVARRLPELAAALESAADYFHDEVREQAVAALPALVSAALAAAPALPPAAPGLPATLVEPARSTYDRVATALLGKLRGEGSGDVVAHAAAAMGRCVALLGRAAVCDHGAAFVDALTRVVDGRAPCRGGGDGGDDDDNGSGGGDDGDDEDGGGGGGAPPPQRGSQAVLEALDALVAIARALGGGSASDDFDAYIGPSVASVERFLQPASPPEDAMMALGFVGELAEAVGGRPAFALVATHLAPVLVAALAAPSARLRRNAAFTAGALAQHATAATRPHLPALLRALQPGVVAAAAAARSRTARAPGGGDATEEALFTDNAVAALARIAAAAPDALPLRDAVSALLACVPLAADAGENAAAYGALLGLLAARRPEALERLADCIAACGAALATAGGDDDGASPVQPAVRAGTVVPGLRRFLAAATEAERGAFARAAAAQPEAARRGLAAAVAADSAAA